MVDNNQIEACLVELKFLNAPGAVETDESLFDTGIIDSLGISALVSLLEKKFGIVVPDEDLLPDNFDSISSIARYVSEK